MKEPAPASELPVSDAIDRCLQRLGLSQNPFSMAPDIVNFYSPERVETVLVEVLQLIDTRMGFALLYGDVGLGKTTICRRILHELDNRGVETSLVFNTSLQEVELLREINRDFGVSAPDLTLYGQMSALNAFLLEQRSQGKNCVIIIDDAQGLTVESLELVRQISNMETGIDKIVQIILVGQPELEEKLNLHSLRQLKSRIVLKRVFLPYTLQETATYIRTKIARSGDRVRLEMTDGAVRCVHEASGGIPRRINVIMGRCLYAAVANNTHVINRDVADTAIRDVEESLDEGDHRSHGRRRVRAAAMAASLLIALPAAALVMNHYGVVTPDSWTQSLSQLKNPFTASRPPAAEADGAAGQASAEPSSPAQPGPEPDTMAGTAGVAEERGGGVDDAGEPDARAEDQAAAGNIPGPGESVARTGPPDAAAAAAGDRMSADAVDDVAKRVIEDSSLPAADTVELVGDPAPVPEVSAAAETPARTTSLEAGSRRADPARDRHGDTEGTAAAGEPATGGEADAAAAMGEDTVAAVSREVQSPSGAVERDAVEPPAAPAEVDDPIWGFLDAYGLTEFEQQLEAAVVHGRFESVSQAIWERTGLRLVVLPGIVADVKEHYTTLQIPTPENDSTNYLLFWDPEEWPEENFSVFYDKEAVKTLQTALSRFGTYHYFIDGLAGPRTIAALELFQRAVGLPQTGKPNVETLFMLEFLNPQRQVSAAQPGVDSTIDRGWSRMEQSFSE